MKNTEAFTAYAVWKKLLPYKCNWRMGKVIVTLTTHLIGLVLIVGREEE